MLEGKRIAVVVPAHNEETQIEKVLNTMPSLVDDVIVVDDNSYDKTVPVLESYDAKGRFTLHIEKHNENRGVGAAIGTGYKKALALGVDATAVMAGDGQMDPNDLPNLLEPIVNGEADYTKGNRLFTGDAWKTIPKIRYFGNAGLSMMTKIASGYWHVADSQTGYTVINKKALGLIDIDNIYPRYGMPNDMLIKLNVINARVKDVPIKPVYNVGEKSGIRIWKVLFTISFMVLRRFIWRLFQKYVIRDFHPLVFFYFFGALFFFGGLTLGGIEIYQKIVSGAVPVASVVLVALLIISGFQFLFFAMWFDMQSNQNLK